MGSKRPFIRYTDEEIARARGMDIIDVISRLRGYTFKLVGRDYKCVEHDSLVIQDDRIRWCWNSQHLKGKGAVSWLMRVEGYDFTTAVGILINKLPGQQHLASVKPYKDTTNAYFQIYRLRDDSYNDKIKGLSFSQLQNEGFQKPEYLRYKVIYNGDFDKLGITGTIGEKLKAIYHQFNSSPPEDYTGFAICTSDIITIDKNSYYVDVDGFKPFKEFKSFGLPIKWQGKYSNVYMYLTETRCIAPCIIKYCFSHDYLYQDVYRNCVFVGYDDSNTPRFASQRSTYQGAKYRPDVSFSDKSYSFNISSAPENDRLFVFESPIDLLSHATLNLIQAYKRCQERGEEYDPQCWLKHNRLSLSGSSHEAALGGYLARHPEIKKIACCLDNDETGQRTAQKIKEFYEPQGYIVTIHHPSRGKDYNDTLVSLVTNSKIQQTDQVIDLSAVFSTNNYRR